MAWSALLNENRTLYFGLYPNEIRLVTLLPGLPDDEIQCRLHHSPLASKPVFKALSYAWGSPKALRPMLLNGFQHSVTVNLDGALRRLRQADCPGTFWIDAICINQLDNNERVHQVNLMRDIYTSAEEVVVYLGELPRDHHNRQRASNTLTPCTTFNFDQSDMNELELFRERCTSGPTCGAPKSRRSIDYAVDVFRLIRCLAQGKNLGDVPPIDKESNEQVSSRYLKRLFETLRILTVSRWWTRIWVIQEAVVPTNVTVILDSVRAPWAMFVEAATCYTRDQSVEALRSFPTDYTKVVERFSRLVLDIESMRRTWSGGHHMSLLSLLRQFGDRHASDDRDKVFALLGLVREEGTVQPDYSVDVPEVYKRTALNTVTTTLSLDVMNGDMGRKFRQDLPSWVPDWSAVRDEREQRRAENASIYHASGDGIIYYPDSLDDELSKFAWFTREQCKLADNTDGIEHVLLQDLEVLEGKRAQIAEKKEELKSHLERERSLLERERDDLPMVDRETPQEQAFLSRERERIYSVLEHIGRQIIRMSQRSEEWIGKWDQLKNSLDQDQLEIRLVLYQRVPRPFGKLIETIQKKEREIQALEVLLEESKREEKLKLLRRVDQGQFGSETKPDTIRYLKARPAQGDFLDVVRMVFLAEGQFATLHNKHDGVLKTPGLYIDTVRSTGVVCHSESHLDIIPAVRSWIGLISSIPEFEICIQLFWRTLCGDAIYAEDTTGGKSLRRIDENDWQNMAPTIFNTHDGDTFLGVDSYKDRYVELILSAVLTNTAKTTCPDLTQRLASAIRTATYRHSLFITEKGHIGLCPASTAPGDHLFILMGAKTPFILRGAVTMVQEAYTDDELEVIGDCYAHGFMDGEGMKEWKKKVYDRLASPRWSQTIGDMKAYLPSTETRIRALRERIDHDADTPQDREWILRNIQSQEEVARTLRRKIEAYPGYVHLV